MCNEDAKITSLIIPEKTVKIPIYSSIKLVNGQIIGELEGYEEFPAEMLPNNNYEH